MSRLSRSRSVESRCTVCGGTTAHELPACDVLIRSVFAGSRVVRCTGCGLTHLWPVPSDVAGVYEQDYFRAYAEEGIRFPAESEAMPARYVRRFDALSGGRRDGRVLDVGSGHGSFLNLARGHGWAVQGIDVSRYAAEQVQQRYGIDVRVGTLEHAAFPAEHFDLIHMSHVLEHLPDPRGTLAEVRRVLKPGGLVAIEVPNELENLGTRVLSAIGLSRPYAVRSTHIWFFSPSTLGGLSSAAGFDLVGLRTFRDTDEPRPIRRAVKQAVRLVEEPLGLAPLIELTARKPVAS